MNLFTEIVGPVFLILLIGFLIGRKKKLNIQPMIDLIVYITSPALIISSLLESSFSIEDFIKIAFPTAIIVFTLGILAYIILKLAKTKKTALILPMSIGNTGYLGFPIALFAFGISGLSMAVVYDAINSIIIFTLGIYLLNKNNGLKEIFRLPLVYAVVIGMLISVFSLELPPLIFKPLQMIGMITIPLALILLGYRLAGIRLKSIKLPFMASLYKIFFGLLISYAAVSILHITGLVKSMIILQSSMPSAVMTMILSQKYGRDAHLVASVVLISTLLSILSVPLVLYLLS